MPVPLGTWLPETLNGCRRVSVYAGVRLSLAVMTTVAALLAGGCGASPGTDAPAAGGHPGTAGGAPAYAFTVEQLATVLGCQANITLRAADYRQASCTAAGTRFVLLDFTTAKGQRDWLEEAESYGGVYLVGDRWALSGQSNDHMEHLRTMLGGNLEGAEGTSAHHSGS
jgi:hypothetical protein